MRGADDRAPRADGPYETPIIFAQNEIEKVGVEPSARLQLLDRFRRDRDDLVTAMESSRAELRSLTAQIRSLVSEIGTIVEETGELPETRAGLVEAQASEKSVLDSLAASAEQMALLESLQSSHASLAG